jgi:hypothetical protein
MAEDQRQETPSLTKIIEDMVDKRLIDVHTSMPATVVSYDYGTNLAVVQPKLKRKTKGQGLIDLPKISNVPVCWPRMGMAHLRLPVTAGDEGEIHFAERSIDSWLSGGEDDGTDLRKHDLSDATFWPGLWSQSNPAKSKAKKTSIEIKNGKGWVEIMANGQFKITDGTEEVLDLMVQLCQAILDARTNTMLGEQPLIHLQDQFRVIMKKLKQLRGT